MSDPEDPADALRLLAPGRPPELVGLLALDLLSPWGSTRVGVRDRPDRRAPLSERDVLEFLDGIAPGDPLPDDRGPLAWLRHHRLAVPVAGIRGPWWLSDAALSPAWVPLPPTGWADDASVLTKDARLVALHVLVACSAGDASVGTAARSLAEWLAGPRRAMWSSTSGGECAALRVDWGRPGPRHWFQAVTGADVDALTATLTGDLLIPGDWTPPPPTEAERAAQAERERILAEGRRATEEWNTAPRLGCSPPDPGNDYVLAALRRTRR